MNEHRIAEIRAAGESGMSIQGTPIVYDIPTVINDPAGNYTEIIRRGALDSAELTGARLLYNHDLNKVPLAKFPTTMRLAITPAGLKMSADLPDTEAAREIYAAIKRGDLSGMSFAFTVPKGGDNYDRASNTRIISRIDKVYDVSIVPFPAYPQTSIEARAAMTGNIKQQAITLCNHILKNHTLKGEPRMKFTTTAEAFNHYRTASIEDMERRAAEIKAEIETGGNADIEALNIELSGIAEARQNILDKRENRGAGFNPITGANFEQRASYADGTVDIISSVEYRNAFYKKLLGQKLTNFEAAAWEKAQTEKRADSFNTTTDSAAVIPTQTLNEVISKARKMGGLLSVCRSFNIPAKISIPVGTPTGAAAWNTEGAEVESEKVNVASVNFGAYEILKVFSISAAVKRMSVPAFENYLADELAASVMATLADGVVNGTGDNQGTGILPGVEWVDDENALAYENWQSFANLAKTVAKLKRGYANGAKWVMNNAMLFTHLYGLMDGNGRPIFLQNPQIDGIGKILGFDVIVDDYMPDDVILFGNFQYMGYNLPEGIAVEASTQSSFKSGRIDYRALAIADCKPIVPEAFVKLYKA